MINSIKNRRATVIRISASVLGGVVFSTLLIVQLGLGYLMKIGVITMAWGAASYIGVRFNILFKQRRQPTWNMAYLIGILTLFVLSILLFKRRQLYLIFDDSVFMILLTYIGAKIGCNMLGCCQGNSKLFRKISLPAFELLFSVIMLLGITLFRFYSNVSQGLLFMIFVALFTGLRAFSYVNRRQLHSGLVISYRLGTNIIICLSWLYLLEIK